MCHDQLQRQEGKKMSYFSCLVLDAAVGVGESLYEGATELT